jgi:NAD(P)-dependent dehydrogenase (short-subunit alcohol dehydrogenase family)
MDLRLACKVTVVIGAGKGIGLAVTRALSDEGGGFGWRLIRFDESGRAVFVRQHG